MKILILNRTNTYPDVVAVIKKNSFGDQLVEFWNENFDGSKKIIGTILKHEGQHVSDREIKLYFQATLR